MSYLKNRLSNLRRDRVGIYKSSNCSVGCDCETCTHLRKLNVNINVRRSLMRPQSLNGAELTYEDDPLHKILKSELFSLIDRNLTQTTRKDYRKYLAGLPLSSFRLSKLHNEIREILLQFYTEQEILEILD